MHFLTNGEKIIFNYKSNFNYIFYVSKIGITLNVEREKERDNIN